MTDVKLRQLYCSHWNECAVCKKRAWARLGMLSTRSIYKSYIHIFNIHVWTGLALNGPCPVGWGCRIHWLHLYRGVRPPNECPRYDTEQSDDEFPVMLELWVMRSTPSLPLLPGPHWPDVVAPDKSPIYGLNRTNGILMLNWIVGLNWIAWI